MIVTFLFLLYDSAREYGGFKCALSVFKELTFQQQIDATINEINKLA